jgi:hypothetical protein
MSGCCADGNETLVSMECGEVLDQLRNYQCLKKDSAPDLNRSFDLVSSVSHYTFTLVLI